MFSVFSRTLSTARWTLVIYCISCSVLTFLEKLYHRNPLITYNEIYRVLAANYFHLRMIVEETVFSRDWSGIFFEKLFEV